MTGTSDTDAKLPLSGICILDLATFLAAPFAATILSEFGAEVIKVEQPGTGDPLRSFGTPDGDATLCWKSEARNRKSICLDLKSREGIRVVKDLVSRVDVVTENFRPGTLEKWGLGYDVLKEINPGLIMLRVSGFGQTGPYRRRPSFARIAHAFGGIGELTGHDEGPPLTLGASSLADYMCGLYGAVGILMALRARDLDGLGQEIDLALYEPVFRALDDMMPTYQKYGVVRGRLGVGASNACPHGHFETIDGRWVALACTSEKMFERLLGAMEVENKPEWATTQQRLADRANVDKAVADWVGKLSHVAVVEVCAAHDIPCALMMNAQDIAEDPHYWARGNWETIAGEDGGEIAVPSPLPRLSRTPGKVRTLGPGLGEHTDEVLELLLSLRRKAVPGRQP